MFVSVSYLSAKNVNASPISEDTYEENDNFWSAYYIGPGFYPNLCQGDDDWFNISIGVDEVIKVFLEFNGSQNDIDLELYDSAEMILDSSYEMDNNESVFWISLVSQTLYIKTFGYNNSEAYNMTVDIFVKGAYDDEYEENDDFPQAPEIFPNYFNNLVNNDTDIYKIYLDQNVSIDVYNTSFLWVQWYDEYYNWLTNFSVEDSHLELDWVTTYPGYYYIAVYGPNLGDFYDIDIWLTGSFDDWAEENDIREDSMGLDLEFYSGFIQNDDDWFSYDNWIFNSEKLEVDLYYDTAFILDIELIDEYGNPHGYSITTESWGKRLEWIAGGAYSNVYIHVHGSNIGLEYNMSLIIDDWAEENDFIGDSYELGLGYYNGLVFNDDDWYRYSTIYFSETLEVELYYDTVFDLNIELIDEYGSPHGYSITTESWGKRLEWTADTYYSFVYIHVFNTEFGLEYDMNLNIIHDDWAEENDFIYDATHLDFDWYGGMILNDEDWYEVWLESNDFLEINLFYDYERTWMNIDLYDEYENYLTSGDWDWDHLHLSWTNYDYSRHIYIKITGNYTENWYDIELILNGQMGDDWAEENDYIYEATYLEFGWHGGMVQNDEDWYNVWLEPYDLLEINLFYDTGYTWMNLELYNEFEGFITDSFMNSDHLHLVWTNDDYGRNVYIKISGNNIGDWYDIDLILNGEFEDDWLEENDDWNSARYMEPGRYNQLFNFDDDYYRFHLNEGDTGKIYIYCNDFASLWLEEISSDDDSILNSDYSTDDGFLELEIYANYDYDVMFAVKGENNGDWYDLDIMIDYKDGNGDDKNGDDKNGVDPFSNFDIPGFPVEIIGIAFMMSTIAVIFFVKKKNH